MERPLRRALVTARRLLFDTSFLIAALDKRPSKQKPYAVQAMQVALAQAAGGKIDILIAATVEAEFLVEDETFERPDAFEPIAFDSECAKVLAKVLRQTRPPNVVRGYWKYDAITLACAVAGNAVAIVTDDGDYDRMIAAANLKIASIYPEEISDDVDGSQTGTGRQIALRRRESEREAVRLERERVAKEKRERQEAEVAAKKAHVERMRAEHPRPSSEANASPPDGQSTQS